jgi:pyruvate dehydrogenase E1 component
MTLKEDANDDVSKAIDDTKGRGAVEEEKLLNALEYILGCALETPESRRSLNKLIKRLGGLGIEPGDISTPYVNTIPVEKEPPYPGDHAIEWRIRSYIRWNAMAMVVKANRIHHGIGGHISTFASCATLYEVAFNHFLRGSDGGGPGDIVYFQGHASPGNYARAYLEWRINAPLLHRFRQELAEGGGLPSYPHPI